MQAFISNVGPNRDQRESAIKKTITTQLSETVKDIQLSNVDDNDSTEARNNLSSIIEAIFLHGLKDSISRRFRRAFADVDEPPQPSFWPSLLVISHRDIIDQINKLSQVKRKEIGRCRAWIRLVLNDSLLSSYLMTIRRDLSALKPYYNTFAYIRDADELELAQKLVEGIENIKLNLPYNTTLLNVWPLPTLLLAGIWCPTLRSLPTASCIDVAQILPATSSVNSETCSIASMLSHSSGIGQMVALNEDEALKIIIAKHSTTTKTSKKEETVIVASVAVAEEEEKVASAPKPIENQKDILTEAVLSAQSSSYGNSLHRQSGWSFDENSKSEPNENEALNISVAIDYKNYNDLIENSYNLFSGTHIRTPDFKEVTKELSNKVEEEVPATEPVKEETTPEVSPTKARPMSIAAQISLIAKERGLDAQDFKCNSCNEQISLSNKLNVCSFTGDYYCDNCMSDQQIPIPARMLHNWDFKSYPVSKKAFTSLEEIKDHPVIDFKTANPFIYTAVREMAKLQILRNQLNYLRAYLFTCREGIFEKMQKQMWPREYLFEHIHQYSITDLLQVSDGDLAKQLEKVIEFGRKHVLNCWLCSQKGFYCEICDDSKLLFPFDTDNVYRCSLCSGVFHKSCLNDSKPCPKCKRRKKGDCLPLLEATLD